MASSADDILLTKYNGSACPFAQQHSSITGPYASRVLVTALSSISRPGLRHAPSSATSNVSSSHVAVWPLDVRQAYPQPTLVRVSCSLIPSNSPSPRNTTGVPSG